ncbi:transglutaminase-like putative cysteine protease [Haloferula luteola]|uniref:Transglutaminase-like putative cysteine protease n=1 Tax=Haloferula luteola TaxID=595692 RepID=A0A840UZD2_9BACT|nr:transglutaminase family protein [Haloferula luteola]MBB5350186.1 transglutaminase-like putative cysteine protease [Haloferula luteola]
MHRFRIIHRTYYGFTGQVILGTHQLLLRPREGHDLRIESSKLDISPTAVVRWHRDIEDNSVATASFSQPASRLAIESEMIIQQFNEAPLDFVVHEAATNYPFEYPAADRGILVPYLSKGPTEIAVRDWIATLWNPAERIETYELLGRINSRIHQTLQYRTREEPGVQSAAQTLAFGSGSCRDFSALFIAAARQLGLAARFVSGYLNAPPSPRDFGSTHAWLEVYLPGAGWKGFDPTTGGLAGIDNIPVAVARDPESVPPIAGSFHGCPGASMDVGVWVEPLGAGSRAFG